MTFIWTEISFLSLWYETAHNARKANLMQLIEEGRFEILTGGWVMTDEANVDLFGMVDQLVEGKGNSIDKRNLIINVIFENRSSMAPQLPQRDNQVIVVCRSFWPRRKLSLCA